jgi:hypothetical protein
MKMRALIYTGVLVQLVSVVSLGAGNLPEDTDGNQIRDDVDKKIASLSLTAPQKKAAEDVARALQATLTDTAQNSTKNQVALINGQVCLASLTKDFKKIGDLLTSATYNTTDRMKTMSLHMKSINSAEMPELPTEKPCQ